MTKSYIRVANLYKTYALSSSLTRPNELLAALGFKRTGNILKQVHALDNVSFEINEGERVGIIGHNGAGKTTLLSILAGLATPTSGTVDICGEIHAILSVGNVLREDLTGRENIYLDSSVCKPGSRLGADLIEQIIQFADLADFIDRPVRTYSTGMKARLAFSMHAFIVPDILIIDETLSVGDHSFGIKAYAKMKEITDKGRVVIFVSHSLTTVVDLCTRCIWLENGKVVMDGDPIIVTEKYKEFVEQSDEAELIKKFSGNSNSNSASHLKNEDISITILQDEQIASAVVEALKSIDIIIKIKKDNQIKLNELHLSITRVDGRVVWKKTISHVFSGNINSCYEIKVKMDPFILGADLYKFDVILLEDSKFIKKYFRVFDVVDINGQFGGKPLLLYPPRINVSKV